MSKAHDFNPSIQEADAGGSLSSGLAWSTEQVPGQPGLHRETLSQENKTVKTTTKGNVLNVSYIGSGTLYMLRKWAPIMMMALVISVSTWKGC